jgi:hypothetical protein
MKKLLRLFFLFVAPAFLLSCETDFNVIANYKEVAIVYGLLNQADSIHYLRINKAFLGDGNSLTYAKVADSSSFGADINVVLTEVTPAGVKREIIFDTVTLSTKEPGDFYSPNQLFYYSAEKLNQENTYELKITNKKTGYEVSAQSRLIHNFNVTKPASGTKTISFKRSITQANKFMWANAVNGKRYQLTFYYNYKEVNGTGDTTYRKISWVFPEIITEKYDGSGESEVGYVNEDFFTLCESKIPYSDPVAEANVKARYSGLCDIEVTAVGDDFNTYLEANAPSTGVLIEKPVYSNITNGLGLLSCRFQIHRLIPLNAETILDLATTTDLKFAKPN